MLDIKRIREDFEGVKRAVESRGKGDFGIEDVRTYDLKRRELLQAVEQMKNEQKVKSKQIPVLKKEGGSTAALIAEMKELDRKSTRLNSSHVTISYAVFCLKKKNQSGEIGRAHV